MVREDARKEGEVRGMSLLALKIKGAMSQGVQVPFRSWEGKDMDSPRTFTRNTAQLKPPSQIDKFVVIYYNSNRKLAQWSDPPPLCNLVSVFFGSQSEL